MHKEISVTSKMFYFMVTLVLSNATEKRPLLEHYQDRKFLSLCLEEGDVSKWHFTTVRRKPVIHYSRIGF